MNDYYVYGLIDPRSHSIFYIGKGKGKRLLHHSKEKLSLTSNSEKLRIIKEIKEAKLEIEYIYVCENLTEQAANLLEKILIFRIGRQIFKEGILTNLVPGGVWSKEHSYFIKEEDIPDTESLKKNFPEIIQCLEFYPKVAKNFQNAGLFFYDISKKELGQIDVDSLIKTTNFIYAIEIATSLNMFNEKIYAYNKIWSSIEFSEMQDISKIPYQNFDVIDFEFVKKVNGLASNNGDKNIVGRYPSGDLRTSLIITSSCSEFILTYFYQDGNKKHITKFLNNRLSGQSLSWYPNGVINADIKYDDNKIKSEVYYYSTRQIKRSRIIFDDNSQEVKDWYTNGQLKNVYNKDESSYSYFENGNLRHKKIKTEDTISKDNIVMTWLYSDEGVLIRESKEQYTNILDRNSFREYNKTYYETGELQTETDYTNGLDNSLTKKYKKNGQLNAE
jgi:antitoxin component YwqK of YwqJK toxin-antitoxin module